MTRSNSQVISITIRDVARRAGVSVATVSRFLNANGPVAQDTRQRLEQAMLDLNYVPKAAARSLATRQSRMIGIFLSSIYGDFFTPLISGIEEVTAAAGFDLLISTANQLNGPQDLPMAMFNTDGMLVFADSLPVNTIQRCYELGLHMVLIQQSAPHGTLIPSVTIENRQASRQVVSHLIEVHGRKRIVMMAGPSSHEDAQLRTLGYKDALHAAGLKYDPQLVLTGGFDRQIAEASLKQFIAQNWDFDAVFTGDDDAAVGVLAALSKAGIQVPEEVSVVGFDNQLLSAYLVPPLTTVNVPINQVGQTAARQLLCLMRGEHPNLVTVLPTELVLRHSCGC
jgi:DNA-binding LacI/PurR family transcriptional regulator